MAKLVRRGGKLLRKSGKLTRSAIDLNPDSPCECCDQPPPDPGTWICNRVTGQCNFELRPGGYATQAECQANCQIGCPTFCYFEIDQRNGVCPSGTYVKSYRPYGPNNPYTLCRIYYPVMGYIGVPPNVSIDPNDSCRLGSQELADYLGGASRSSTLTYKSGVTVNGIACSDGRCYPNDAIYGGCPVQVFP
jgi:hypothetical protein